MPIVCASPKTSPVLARSLSGWRRSVGHTLDTMKKIEDLVPAIPIWNEIGAPLFKASAASQNWTDKQRTALSKIAGKFSSGTSENVLAAMIGDRPERFYEITPKQQKAALELENMLAGVLKETGGLTEAQAHKFLREDLVKLRGARGDFNRLDINNIYPTTFAPFMDELARGDASATHNNAYALAWDIINMGARTKFLRPVSKAAQETVDNWTHSLRGKVDRKDIRLAQNYADDFIRSNIEQQGQAGEVFTSYIDGLFNMLEKVGIKRPPDTAQWIDRMAANMTSWYSNMAMSARPAMVVRDALQPLLAGPKVGTGRVLRSFGDYYGRKLDDSWQARAASDLDLPEGINQPLYVGEGTDGFLATRLFRGLKRAQDIGMMPRRWVDKADRFVTYRAGELAVLEEAPALTRGEISWEEFLMRTGLKGSHKIDQDKIHSMLMGKELADIPNAAREYGTTLSHEVNFIYHKANSPLMFKGTMGKLFGQFGTWPIGFAEYMWQNMATPDWGYRTKFAADYAKVLGAVVALGHATGVDTSNWMSGNPLGFQGGPWFQAMRDVTTLATSTNEFETRKARAGVTRMVSHFGTPFAGVLNPFGGATTDLIQAVNAKSPVEALILALGFNMQSPTTATQR